MSFDQQVYQKTGLVFFLKVLEPYLLGGIQICLIWKVSFLLGNQQFTFISPQVTLILSDFDL